MSEIHLAQLRALPAPSIIAEIDFEERLSGFFAELVPAMQKIGFNYDVETLENDPAAALLQVATYTDVSLRQRINEAFVAELLAFADGSNLDHVAAFYQIFRLSGERDDAFRSRVVLGIQAKSGLETEWRYEFIARSADVRVRDVRAYVKGRSPIIYLAVLSTDNAGIADTALLEKVRLAVQTPNRRALNDTIVVEAAAQLISDITAQFTLLPQAEINLIETIRTNLMSAWLQELALGRDVTRSWLLSKLQIEGVHSVNLINPALDIVVPANRVGVLGETHFEIIGRDY